MLPSAGCRALGRFPAGAPCRPGRARARRTRLPHSGPGPAAAGGAPARHHRPPRGDKRAGNPGLGISGAGAEPAARPRGCTHRRRLSEPAGPGSPRPGQGGSGQAGHQARTTGPSSPRAALPPREAAAAQPCVGSACQQLLVCTKSPKFRGNGACLMLDSCLETQKSVPL